MNSRKLLSHIFSSPHPNPVKRGTFYILAVISTALVISHSALTYGITKSDVAPPLTSEQITELQNLPYGIGKQRSLILRYRHVGSIQFYGSAHNSNFTFQRGHGLIPEGLSLKLKNSGKFSWASGIVRFKTPVNARRYNSIVLWVRTTHPGLKFWMGVQDPTWKRPEIYQARTDILPFRGLPVNRPVQLVVPFQSIYEESPVDYRELTELAFEFGEDTVGNFQEGEIEILGIAFVRQTPAVNKVKLIIKESISSPPASVVTAPEKEIIIPPLDTGSADILSSEPTKPSVPPYRSGLLVSQYVDFEDKKTTDLFNQYGFEMRAPTIAPVASEFKKESFKETLWGMIEAWQGVYTPVQSTEVADSISNKRTSGTLHYILIGLSLFVGILVGVLWFRRQKNRNPSVGHLDKIFHEVRWLFSQNDLPASSRYEDDFWKGLANKNMRFAWISAHGASIQRSPNDKFFGETFLKRQIKKALENGIHLFPNVSFVRTVFNYESFLLNPTLFHLRHVAAEDFQLNDDELRIKEKEAFPIWIPPFWQKKFRLPNRVLVEYGKSLGIPHSRESVEYNRTATALRKIAIQTLEELATVSPGVRIENATWLLNSKIWGRYPVSRTHPSEFWREVIGTIKAKYPHFLFLADGVGEEAKSMLQLGFDYFEDDYFIETLVRQIRLGQVGNLPFMLNGEWVELLRNAIFNVTRLLRPVPTSEIIQRQNMLAAILLIMLPSIIQHDDNLPDELERFVKWTSNSTVFRKGKFSMLRATPPSVMAFARWKSKALYIAVANFSNEPQDAMVRLDPILPGIDENKLYLFNNALHGSSPLKSVLDQSNPPHAPALALWGQNLRDHGLPVHLNPLSLKLFSVNMTRPILSTFIKDPIAPTKTVR